MMPPKFAQRAWLVFTLIPTALAISSCEGDVLAPANTYQPTDCTKPGFCNPAVTVDGGLITLDTGVPAPPDSGVIPADPPDAGPLPDSGLPPPPDSGVLPDPPDAGNPGVDAGPPPPPPPFLNLAGTYRVHYVMDLSSLFLGIGNIAGALDFLDRLGHGRGLTGFAPLDALIGQIIQNYVPPWVLSLIHVLNGLANFLTGVETWGTLNISQGLPTGNTSPLVGNETWNRMQVMVIDRCPAGQNDPNYPSCAQYNVPLTMGSHSVGQFDVAVNIHDPFPGVLNSGVPEADFSFQRDIDMEMTKLVRLLLDVAIQAISQNQYMSLADALNHLADCNGLAAQAAQLAQGLGPLGIAAAIGVLTECNNLVSGIQNGLNSIPIGNGLNFTQHGHAIDRNGDGRADTLQSLSVHDSLNGDISGAWETTP